MKVRTSRFGEIDVDEGTFLTFPSGIIGFPQSQRYVMLEHDRPAPFQWLQSVDEPELAFLVADPADFTRDYQVTVRAEDLADLGPSVEADLALLVILTMPSPDPGEMTANLRGPIIANQKSRVAKQLVLSEELPTRWALFPQAAVRQGEPATSCAAVANMP
jgi:flagellar assembly factor FliW